MIASSLLLLAKEVEEGGQVKNLTLQQADFPAKDVWELSGC